MFGLVVFLKMLKKKKKNQFRDQKAFSLEFFQGKLQITPKKFEGV